MRRGAARGRSGTVRMLARVVLVAAAMATAVVGTGCRKSETGRLDPVRALRARVEPRFRTPSDGRLTDAQIDAYLKVVAAARSAASEADAARAAGVDAAEVDWTRSRIIEALSYLDARRVADEAFESYGKALVTLREARKAAPDPATAARLDAQIASAERERAALKRGDPPNAVLAANAARVAPFRARIEAAGP